VVTFDAAFFPLCSMVPLGRSWGTGSVGFSLVEGVLISFPPNWLQDRADVCILSALVGPTE